jgi:hypothetical protein
MSARRSIALASALLAALLAFPAGAVIIDSGVGTGNTSAPADDPGWDHVGIRNGLCAIYLRNGWVLTANHVATGPVELGGVVYDAVPGSAVRIGNGDGTEADLKVFALTPDPGLPELPIRSNRNLPKGEVTLIGNGRNRGAATDSDDPTVWVPPPAHPQPAIAGYLWGSGRTLRWGRNIVAGEWPGDPDDTVAFYTIFDAPGSRNYTTHESQGAPGDSGGGVFAKQGGSWELAGIMYLIGLYDGQVANSALYGNWTGAADLSFYRDEILELTAIPEPRGLLLLGPGLVFLATLGRRRIQP